jgi:chloramphenicol 3-O phosphotransferase
MSTSAAVLPGQIVILNGAPRSGKTSIARALQERGAGPWMNLGVDTSTSQLPETLRPGIGLRPGGERPELEELVVMLYGALWEAIAAHARLGLNVVVDVGLHESYSKPRDVRCDGARRLQGLPVLFVGVHCPLVVIGERRANTWGQTLSGETELSEAVRRWQVDVHEGLVYDLEVDTAQLTPAQCADRVAVRIAHGPPGDAFGRLADFP